MIPGEWLFSEGPIEINVNRRRLQLSVRNKGDRPIQVGSHFHFFEVNRALDFDRPVTLGMRLDVPSGQSIRFEAGDERDVELVELGGTRLVVGFNNLLDGATSGQWTVERAIERARTLGFSGVPNRQGQGMAQQDREATAKETPSSLPDGAVSSGTSRGRHGERSA